MMQIFNDLQENGPKWLEDRNLASLQLHEKYKSLNRPIAVENSVLKSWRKDDLSQYAQYDIPESEISESKTCSKKNNK